MANIDVKWFQNRIADLGLSQRRLSAMIATNPNTVSLILSGKRKVSHEEIPALAKLLDASPDEILKRLGAEPPHDTRPSSVRVTGTADETGRVSPPNSRRTVEPPSNRGAIHPAAIVIETAGTARSWQHGWVFYYDAPAKPRYVDADTLDRLCVLEIGDRPGQYVGIVRRSTEQGRFDLVDAFTGSPIIQGISVRSAAPVTFIKAA